MDPNGPGTRPRHRDHAILIGWQRYMRPPAESAVCGGRAAAGARGGGAEEEGGPAFSHGPPPAPPGRRGASGAGARGGPPLYSDAYGDETSVVRIHSGN